MSRERCYDCRRFSCICGPYDASAEQMFGAGCLLLGLAAAACAAWLLLVTCGIGLAGYLFWASRTGRSVSEDAVTARDLVEDTLERRRKAKAPPESLPKAKSKKKSKKKKQKVSVE